MKIEAAFGTLRKSAVSDDLDIKLLDFQRELGKGASGKRGTSGADTPGEHKHSTRKHSTHSPMLLQAPTETFLCTSGSQAHECGSTARWLSAAALSP